MDNTVDLVMTVPKPHDNALVYQMGCRTTLGVLVQLIAQAERRIIISAPFVYTRYDNASGIIIESITSSLRRGVNVDFLSTGSSLTDLRMKLQIDDILLSRLKLYQTSDNYNDEQILGSHAKFCVADGESAYIGSANLTCTGLVGQLELGLLVHGEIAKKIEHFWDYSIEQGAFKSFI